MATTTEDGRSAAPLDELPIRPIHRKLVVLVGMGLFFDLYELFLAGTITGVLKQQLQLSTYELSGILASAFAGQFVGALVLGRLSDVFGRRRMFMINIGLYAGFTLLGAFSPNVWFLMVTRALAGLGIGAEMTVSDTYLSEVMPPQVRGRMIAVAYTIGFCAVPTVGFLARWLVPMHPFGVAGWRWLFVIGGLGAALVFVARRHMPESPHWVRRAATTARAPFLEILRAPFRTRTLLFSAVMILQVFGYYGFGTLAVLVLQAKGFTVVNSLGYLAITYLGYPIGSLLAIPLIERVRRKYLVLASAALMAVFGLIFGFATSVPVILLAGGLFTLASNVFSDALHTYLPESFPTSVRGTASGTTYSLSKLSTAIQPFLLLPLLERHGPGAVFTVITAALVIMMGLIAVWGPLTGRNPLEAG
ncbi:MFS transporter [Nocardia terpenica]|uniref:MFS transporter n=1 Tax=Nocardia terpenica TaxID=455432 RepID=UPI00189368C9|nr:MFS transporter [Nocardia terpenica]MBF6061716.1 MFS transporter [Nocardia terpenica]MBF6107489.1 MFS transporter [Nocardia terpenica]MBF6110136.1 MFS transporter [Nocardia terpenica]MBF6122352.1 MFS transporter [Nocardia terpenica]MBF6151472.1 MFS transporter [Nocardia terpenica]